MGWNQLLFEEAVRNKMATQRESAAADTTRANAAAQDVSQRPEIQARTDAAAMDRAQIASQTQLSTTDMVNQAQAARAAAANAAQTNIATLQDQGATTRTGMQTGTQRDIASQTLGFDREKLAQQGQQFGQTFGLDTAKAQEAAIQSRATLGMPEYGTPTYNYNKKQIETMIKRPAITNLAPSPLSTLGGQNGIGMESDDTLRKIRSQLAQ